MILFLTSSPTGPLDRSRPVEGFDRMNGFADNLRSRWPINARCLMIPAAPEAPAQNREMTAFFAQALATSGLSASVFDLWDEQSPEAGRLANAPLDAYDVIFLGGGHVPTQNAFFHRIGLREKMKTFSGIVIGISAGSMNSADNVYAQPELPGEEADPAYVRFLTGLGLTDTRILPHYQMVKNNYLDGLRLFEDISYGDSYGTWFLVLPDGSYLLKEGGTETVFGEAWIIEDGAIRKICENGSCAAL